MHTHSRSQPTRPPPCLSSAGPNPTMTASYPRSEPCRSAPYIAARLAAATLDSDIHTHTWGRGVGIGVLVQSRQGEDCQIACLQDLAILRKRGDGTKGGVVGVCWEQETRLRGRVVYKVVGSAPRLFSLCCCESSCCECVLCFGRQHEVLTPALGPRTGRCRPRCRHGAHHHHDGPSV